MSELKKTHISEIATLYAVQDKPDAYYYDATEAEKVIAEKDKELHDTKRALWIARSKICKLEVLSTLHREWEWTDGALDAFRKAERKCRQYADKFKEDK